MDTSVSFLWVDSVEDDNIQMLIRAMQGMLFSYEDLDVDVAVESLSLLVSLGVSDEG